MALTTDEIALQLTLRALEKVVIKPGIEGGKLIATLYNEILKNISVSDSESSESFLKVAEDSPKPGSDVDKVFDA